MSTIVSRSSDRRGDVQEHDLVGALAVVPGGQLDRIAGVDQIDEVDALDHPAGVDVETRDHPHRPHAEPPSASIASVRVNARS